MFITNLFANGDTAGGLFVCNSHIIHNWVLMVENGNKGTWNNKKVWRHILTLGETGSYEVDEHLSYLQLLLPFTSNSKLTNKLSNYQIT